MCTEIYTVVAFVTPPLVKPISLMAVTLSSTVFRGQLLFFDVSHNSCCVAIDHLPKFQVSYSQDHL